MKKNRVVVSILGLLAVLFTAALLTDHERVAVAGDGSIDQRSQVLRTAPTMSGTTREEMERNYRSCLFSFLPQVGSDAAAEMLRDACRDEYRYPEK